MLPVAAGIASTTNEPVSKMNDVPSRLSWLSVCTCQEYGPGVAACSRGVYDVEAVVSTIAPPPGSEMVTR